VGWGQGITVQKCAGNGEQHGEVGEGMRTGHVGMDGYGDRTCGVGWGWMDGYGDRTCGVGWGLMETGTGLVVWGGDDFHPHAGL